MGADRALIDAAFKLGASQAAANVPNLKPLYESTMSITKGAAETLSGIIEGFKEDAKKERAAKEKQLKPFKVIAEKAYQSLFEVC